MFFVFLTIASALKASNEQPIETNTQKQTKVNWQKKLKLSIVIAFLLVLFILILSAFFLKKKANLKQIEKKIQMLEQIEQIIIKILQEIAMQINLIKYETRLKIFVQKRERVCRRRKPVR